MLSLGEYLRTERERRGVTLEQLQESTKIRVKYLRAIEIGNFNEIPGEVYLKGFLRSYAEGIGLSGSDILDRYAQLKSEQGFIERGDLRRAQEKASEQQRTLPSRKSSRASQRKARALSITATALILAIVGSVIIYNAVTGDDKDPSSTASTITGDDRPIPAHDTVAGKSKTEDPVAARVNTSSAAAAESEKIGLPVNISLSGLVRSWVKIVADGKSVYQGFIAKGDDKEWSARSAIELTMTNAGGVSVAYNGKRLGALGDTGQFMTRVFRAEVMPGKDSSDEPSSARPVSTPIRGGGRSTGVASGTVIDRTPVVPVVEAASVPNPKPAAGTTTAKPKSDTAKPVATAGSVKVVEVPKVPVESKEQPVVEPQVPVTDAGPTDPTGPDIPTALDGTVTE